jgi:hypothetical protein
MGVQARVKKLNLAIVVKKRKNLSPGGLWRWGVKANAISEDIADSTIPRLVKLGLKAKK